MKKSDPKMDIIMPSSVSQYLFYDFFAKFIYNPFINECVLPICLLHFINIVSAHFRGLVVLSVLDAHSTVTL